MWSPAQEGYRYEKRKDPVFAVASDHGGELTVHSLGSNDSISGEDPLWIFTNVRNVRKMLMKHNDARAKQASHVGKTFKYK